MNSIRFRLFLLCVALLVAASSGLAQTYPFPASTPNTDVPCSSCVGAETLLTIGYPPVLKFVGRWADSSTAKDYQQNFRTARPKMARAVPSRNRIYTILGSALVAYNTDTFIARLSARPQEAMLPATAIPVSGGNARYAMWGPPEVFLWWDAFFYAENGGGWVTPFEDGLERLWDFDWDDRGNIYLAYSTFGWGIVKDSGDMGGGWFQSLSQTLRVNSITPDHIMSLKTSDGKYYAAVSDKNNSSLMQIWDVQNALVPVKQPDIAGRSFYQWAKDSTGSRVGIVEYSGGMSIFTTDDFVRTGTPLIHLEAGGGGSFRMMTGDGTNFYAYGVSDAGPFVDVISPSGRTYAETRYPVHGYGVPQGMHYGDGYLAVYGVEGSPVGAWNIRVYKVSPAGLTEVPFEMPVPGSGGARQQPFWSMYYSSNSPQGYVHPFYNNFMDVLPVKVGGKMYLVVADIGLGDVWELKAGDSLSLGLTPSVSGGPFYGDTLSFTSTLASGNVADVIWDFGDNTTATSVTGAIVKHQYSGVTSPASLPLVRHVTVSLKADPSISDSLTVTLVAPTPRFQLGNTAYLFRQPDASSTAPIVAGDSFVDASDGAAGGHYTDWVLEDGVSHKKLPNEPFPVGPCGEHTLAFNTHYGPYVGTGDTLRSTTDLPLSISPFHYLVRPYILTVKDPDTNTINNPKASFTTSVHVAGANDLPGGIDTPVTYTWEVVEANNSPIPELTKTGSATLGSIPQYDVVRDPTFNTLGRRVRLTTTVTAAAVPGPGCSGGAKAVAESSVLNGPDPVIVKTGCATVGTPCSFTVSSANNPTLAGWSFAWSVSPTVPDSGATGSEFKPQFATTTDYSVSVIVTNGIGSKTATLAAQHIDKPTCSSAPDQINNAIGINSNTTPSPGDTVSFTMFPRGLTPSAECDKFAWDFGDGGHSTEMYPTHIYQSGGKYTVALVYTGALATATYTTTVQVGPVVTPPDNGNNGNGNNGNGNNGGCPAPGALSVYPTYYGSASFCTTTGGTCNPGESLDFGILSNGGYNYNCGSGAVTWNFGDSTTGSGFSAKHAYAAAGVYHAQMTFSNTAGSYTYPMDVKVGSVAPKPCGTLTQQNVNITFSGPACTESSGNCKAQDLVSFVAVGNGYDFSCTTATHTYNWDFADGSTHSTSAQPSHAFPAAGDYNVKLTVSNGTSSATITRKVTIAATGDPVKGGPCGTMVPETNVYVTFFGDGCSLSGGNCSAKADVGFGVMGYGYSFDCAQHTYTWDFGDGTHESGATPTHKYPNNGTYHVVVHVSNGPQTVDLTATVKVVNGVSPVPRGGHAVRH